MKLAIMQPYFLPYIGYFQLIQAVDEFVVYDNIEFSKRGWVQRNRILMNGLDQMFSIPLKKDSDYRQICERRLADSFVAESQKILRKIESAYRKAPYFSSAMPVIEQCFTSHEKNLFQFIEHSLLIINRYLNIKTKITISSELQTDDGLKGQKRIFAICHALSAFHYINAIGGQNLYNQEIFAAQGIQLFFIKSKPIVYPQFGKTFVPNLSIVDVMMFNPIEKIHEFLNSYDLI